MSETLWMWRRAWALLERAEQLQRQMFQPGMPAERRQAPVWEPPADVYEAADGLHVVVALPGVDLERVEFGLDGHWLYIAARCRRPPYAGAVLHRMEIPHGCFERRLWLPSEDFEIVSRELANGCLHLLVRRSDRADT